MESPEEDSGLPVELMEFSVAAAGDGPERGDDPGRQEREPPAD